MELATLSTIIFGSLFLITLVIVLLIGFLSVKLENDNTIVHYIIGIFVLAAILFGIVLIAEDKLGFKTTEAIGGIIFGSVAGAAVLLIALRIYRIGN